MELYATTAGDEALLLDLLNTTPVIDGTATDVLRDLATAAAWLTDHDVAATEDELTGLVAARRVLQAVVRGDRTPAALEPFLDRVRLRPVATDHGVDWRLTEATGATRAVLAWIADRLAAEGVRVLALVRDDGPWHVGREVLAWSAAHNRRVKTAGCWSVVYRARVRG